MKVIYVLEAHKEFDPNEFNRVFVWGFSDLTSANEIRKLCIRRFPDFRWAIHDLQVDDYNRLNTELDELAYFNQP